MTQMKKEVSLGLLREKHIFDIMKQQLYIFTLTILLSCQNTPKKTQNETQPEENLIESQNEGKAFKDFDIFSGKGIDDLNDKNSFPRLVLNLKNDSMYISYYFDNLIQGTGLLKFKVENDFFYRVDTLEFDGQKSIWYEYHTKNHVILFEKNFKDKKKINFQLTASLLTQNEFQEFDLYNKDTLNIGINIDFLSGRLPKTRIDFKNIKIDEINPRAKLATFSLFWHHFLCSGKYWIGYGVSCDYLD